MATDEMSGLTDYEYCVLMRRRSGFTQKKLAKELGVTRLWVNLMERGKGNPAILIEYWKNKK